MSAYLQYNARCEFFTNGFFPPSPECRDAHCTARQAELKGKPGWLQLRKERVAKAKAAKAGTDRGFGEAVDPAEWGIELVGESEPRQEEFVDKKQAAEATLEDLMGQIKALSLGTVAKQGD